MERPSAVEPFLRGLAWPSGLNVAYPRADPADSRRLPADTWAAAMTPVGVRLEIEGTARQIMVEYEAFSPQPNGFMELRSTFMAWKGGRCTDEQKAQAGSGSLLLQLGEGSERAVIYLPESFHPLVTKVEPVDGHIQPPPTQPRWLAYGDSIAEGWIASAAASSWVSVAGREFGLDAVNLGYAGAARGEIVSAEQIARIPADVISISHGTNCWGMIPSSAEMMFATTEGFLRIVRSGHPGIPIVVVSPLVRPDAENSPNRLGATLGDLRTSMESAVRAVGDELTTLIPGRELVSSSLLGDGIHPNDEGHKVLADLVGTAVRAAFDRTS